MSSQIGNGASLGGGLGGVRESRLRTQRDHLAGLKDSMEQVATKLRSGGAATQAQRTALVARFNDLQRQVNELDGIVAGEGQEARAQGQVAGAPVRPQATRGTVPQGDAGPAPTAATPTPAAAGTTTEGDQVNVVA